MGSQFCVALLRLNRLTGLHNYHHMLDFESDIIGTLSKVVRLVESNGFTHKHWTRSVHGTCPFMNITHSSDYSHIWCSVPPSSPQMHFPWVLTLNSMAVAPDLLWSTNYKWKTYVCTELLRGLVEILSACSKFSQKFGVKGNGDLIIVSGVIIPPRACENTHRIFFSPCATNHLHLLCEGFSRTQWRDDLIGAWIVLPCDMFACLSTHLPTEKILVDLNGIGIISMVMDTPRWFRQNLLLGAGVVFCGDSSYCWSWLQMSSDNPIILNHSQVTLVFFFQSWCGVFRNQTLKS